MPSLSFDGWIEVLQTNKEGKTLLMWAYQLILKDLDSVSSFGKCLLLLSWWPLSVSTLTWHNPSLAHSFLSCLSAWWSRLGGLASRHYFLSASDGHSRPATGRVHEMFGGVSKLSFTTVRRQELTRPQGILRALTAVLSENLHLNPTRQAPVASSIWALKGSGWD